MSLRLLSLGFLSLLVFCMLLLSSPAFAEAQAQEKMLPEDYWRHLLRETRAAVIERQLEEEARYQLNKAARDTQVQALAEARQALQAAQAERTRLEAAQLQLEAALAEAQAQLQRRSAHLGEVFAVYAEEKGHLHSHRLGAWSRLQYPEQAEAFRPSLKGEIPDLQALEALWRGLQETWMASTQVVLFQGAWVDAQGHRQEGPLLRLGDLQLLNAAGFLRFEAGQAPSLWPRQPPGVLRQVHHFLEAALLESAPLEASELRPLPLDPARGLTLELYHQQPAWLERLQQGGPVGYVILFLGTLGLLLALVRGLGLAWENRRIQRQLRALDAPEKNNALGRVLAGLAQAGQHSPAHPEALEAKMNELLLREAARLERGVSWVKLLAAIAPLLGLLGTVTGMIATFQAITFFGTGDPGMMAGGISQALMTTVLGLVTAIPLLFAHLLLLGRSRQLTRTLEAEAAAWLATHLAVTVTTIEGQKPAKMGG